MNKHVLIFASNYYGSWKIYQSVSDAIKMKSLFEELGVSNIDTYLNNRYIRSNVIPAMKNLAEKLNKPNQIGIIYNAGHGNWTKDTNGDEDDGMDELWNTHTDNVYWMMKLLKYLKILTIHLN